MSRDGGPLSCAWARTFASSMWSRAKWRVRPQSAVLWPSEAAHRPVQATEYILGHFDKNATDTSHAGLPFHEEPLAIGGTARCGAIRFICSRTPRDVSSNNASCLWAASTPSATPGARPAT